MKTKRCSKCKKIKPLDEFYEDTSTDGRYSPCKQCSREYKRQYYAKHREEENRRTAQWRADNPEYDVQYNVKRREESREYSEENRKYNAQWRADNPDYHRRYRISNADKYRIYAINRYVRSIAAKGTFTDEQFTGLCKQHGNHCLCCGRKDVKLTVDHIVPLSRGGSNNIKNIQPLCQSCNSIKGTKIIDYRTNPTCNPLHPIQPPLPGLIPETQAALDLSGED